MAERVNKIKDSLSSMNQNTTATSATIGAAISTIGVLIMQNIGWIPAEQSAIFVGSGAFILNYVLPKKKK